MMQNSKVRPAQEMELKVKVRSIQKVEHKFSVRSSKEVEPKVKVRTGIEGFRLYSKDQSKINR